MTRKRTETDREVTGSGESSVLAESPVKLPYGRPAGRKPKDSLLGGIVIASTALLLVVFAGFLIYLGYRVMEIGRDDRQSIGVLPESFSVSSAEDSSEGASAVYSSDEASGVAEEAKQSVDIDKATIAVTVLNGGAPGGTAGKVVKLLVDAGFSKASSGNADGTHVGVVIYYDEDSEAAALLVKEALSGAYADVKIARADPEKKDTSVAPVTVIVTK